MNAIYNGFIGTKGLKWHGNPANGRYIVLGDPSAYKEGEPLIAKSMPVAGLDPTKVYAIRTMSDDGCVLKVRASPEASPIPDADFDAAVTLTAPSGNKVHGTIVNAASLVISVNTFEAFNPDGPVRARYGDAAIVVARIYEVSEKGTPILDGAVAT